MERKIKIIDVDGALKESYAALLFRVGLAIGCIPILLASILVKRNLFKECLHRMDAGDNVGMPKPQHGASVRNLLTGEAGVVEQDDGRSIKVKYNDARKYVSSEYFKYSVFWREWEIIS